MAARCVVYQIDVCSFADSDGDGLGDLAGIRSHLDAVSDLGADAIWIAPCALPPDDVGGASDPTPASPTGIDPRLGTLADFDALVRDAHDLGLRVILGLDGTDQVGAPSDAVRRFWSDRNVDELHPEFDDAYRLAGWDAGALGETIRTAIERDDAVGMPSRWMLSSQSSTRMVTRFGGGALGERRARAAALLTLALPGVAYIYQGEELGLPAVEELRDGCRVPLPWRSGQPAFGFSPSGVTWLPQPDAWAALTREAQERDPDSTYHLYRSALRWRRSLAALRDQELQWITTVPDGLVAMRRGDDLVCVANTGPAPLAPPEDVGPDAEVLIASASMAFATDVPPDTTVWYRTHDDRRRLHLGHGEVAVG